MNRKRQGQKKRMLLVALGVTASAVAMTNAAKVHEVQKPATGVPPTTKQQLNQMKASTKAKAATKNIDPLG